MTHPTARSEITRVLRALGGVATRGDLIMATGLPLREVEGGLEALMAEERVQVAVSESAVLVYRLHERRAQPRDGQSPPPGYGSPSGRSRWRGGARRRRSTHARDRAEAFDRKTLGLIRARGGVISLAELVEHTGLTLDRARREADRLAALYGGESHPSLDGHVVYAFRDLVESAHGDFHVREPRPAWARADDPLEDRGGLPGNLRWAVLTLGAVAAGVLAWLFTFPPAGGARALLLAGVAGASAGTAFALTGSALRRIARHPRFRIHRADTLRRYTLGYVFETALKGKGVVSLDRTVSYLRARTGAKRISRRKVEAVLRHLAAEFGAPISRLEGDLFFGFRSVKRQFLASHVQRVRLQLERRAGGRTLFDSGDSELKAAERELKEFDRDLRGSADAPR